MAAIVQKGYRPTKQAEIPPPLYLTSIPGDEPTYCHACGRVVGSRKIKAGRTSATTARFCSDKCKHHKPSSALGSIDRAIEDALYLLLNNASFVEVIASLPAALRSASYPTPEPTGPETVEGNATNASQTTGSSKGGSTSSPSQGVLLTFAAAVEDTRRPALRKGDHRLTVPCSLVETLVFGRRANVSRAQGRRRRRAANGDAGTGHEGSHARERDQDAYDEAQLTATLARLRGTTVRDTTERAKGSGSDSDVSGEEASSSDDEGTARADGQDPGEADAQRLEALLEQKRKEGQQRAVQRERVRNACRRAVVFGLLVPGAVAPGPAQSDTAQSAKGAQDEEEEEEQRRGKGAKGRKAGKGKRDDAAPPESGAGCPGSLESGQRRLCEAVMRGEIVEPSFAKGEWGVRWREE